MSYCVHCGVELDPTASFCPLCHTPVADPRQPVDTGSPKPFPTRRGEVAPVSKVEVGLLITAMLASVAVCCGVLNLFLHAGRAWSLYVIGAAAMLWLWLVPPLLARGMHLLLRLAVGVGAVLLYVYLISVDLDGRTWFLGLAAPLILWGGAVLLVLGLVLNCLLGFDIWDYSNVPLNLLGQVCLPYSFLWMGISLPAMALCELCREDSLEEQARKIFMKKKR